MKKPYRMKAGSRKSYRKQTQHVRRYRSGRWTFVNRGIKYLTLDEAKARHQKELTRDQINMIDELKTRYPGLTVEEIYKIFAKKVARGYREMPKLFDVSPSIYRAVHAEGDRKGWSAEREVEELHKYKEQ